MAWNDRLKSASYTSPSGDSSSFSYEDVSHSFDKKTTGYTFPDADGTYVQDFGVSGRRYPMRVFFWGDDCDLEADAFELLLSESGVGRLEHPLYGTVDVVPFGTITRNDRLKTAANQAVIEVTFWNTIGVVYPTAETDPASDVLTAVEEFNDAESSSFFDFIDIDTAIERISLENRVTDLISSAKSGLQEIADSQSDVKEQFDTIYSSIDQGLDVLVETPLTLAYQSLLLVQSPARAVSSITARLSAFVGLSDLIIESATEKSGNDSRYQNDFHAKELFATAYVTGSILSVVNNQFSTKNEALEAADTILTQFSDVEEWIEENYEFFEEIDTGSSYQQLQEAVAITAGFLVEISFSLKQERKITLDRNRTIIDLVSELYGSVDDDLDFFISSNNLSCSEILELERGREIVYYI